jgi:type III pantothenate kinase
MLLAIDVGNTHTVLGVFQEEKLLVDWRVATNRTTTEDELAVLLRNLFQGEGLAFKQIQGICISSVVPPILRSLEALAAKYFRLKPMLVGPGMKTGLTIKYENPKEVGADRIVNAVAALERYGGPLIIVDLGTATTFCVVSEEWEYLGGIISPGVGISAEALFRAAAKLPRVELAKPKNVIGRNTIGSMQSGLLYGFAGQIDGIVERIWQELGTKTEVIATGGLAELLAPETRTIGKVDPLLTLKGLRLLYTRNRDIVQSF